ncbi:hypothetical protein [Plantactinospora sp. KBS50]|uniref:hypothetical protein n=1 Tax=Plantactinospora sp. KBS50 TaxID=2024580 RepID=UPI001E4D61DD|nr:hypothetical protein [Plantactinospora sp. KBS50]
MLWLVAGALLVLLLVAGGAVFIWYDRATTLDRSAPDVTVDNYLRAYLVDRNDVRAQQYECSAGSNLEPIRSLRAEIEDREEQFSVTVQASWGALMERVQDRTASVQTSITIASFADGAPRSRRHEDWAFSLTSEDGWRVCGAERLG